jgi:hypothetical protein
MNFIWGGKDVPARTKVKWNTLALPIAQGGLGIIDPKTQSEALLAKLLVKGLALGEEPWKEFVRHKANQIRLPVHGKGPNTPDINWLFVAPKLKRIQCSMWKKIVGAWLNVRPGLTKADPTNTAKTLRQPLFDNLSILNTSGTSLGISGQKRLRIRALWMLSNHRLVELRRQRMEKPLRTGDELPRLKQKMEGHHHRQHPLAPRRVHQPHTSRRLDQQPNP